MEFRAPGDGARGSITDAGRCECEHECSNELPAGVGSSHVGDALDLVRRAEALLRQEQTRYGVPAPLNVQLARGIVLALIDQLEQLAPGDAERLAAR